MFIDGVKIDFREIKLLNDFPEQIKRSDYFKAYMEQLEIKLRDYKHNTNDKVSIEYLRGVISDIRLNATKSANCDLNFGDIQQIQHVIDLAIIGGSIIVKFK